MRRSGFVGGAMLRQDRRNPRFVSPSQTQNRKHRPAYALLVYMSALLTIGAVVVYAIGPGLTNGTELGENYYSYKQLLAIVLGCIGFGIASVIPISTWKKIEPYLLIVAAIVAVLVRVIGDEVNGAHRWIQVGGLSFQAAELIKLALVLWTANYLSRKKLDNKISDSNTLKTLGIVVAMIIVVVAGLQSDLGSAVVMMAIVGVTAYASGFSMKKIGLGVALVVVLSTIAIASSPYRRDRVLTFLNPEADCQVEGYQACQALITIGSGGIVGKGLGKSVQAYGYLPEPANDSIYAIVSEKFGFIGSITVLLLFVGLFTQIKRIAQAAPDDYSRLLVTGILVWLSAQMIINVGAMVGLLPLKGITLPFVSYGGTSIIFVMIAMGIVFNVSRYTDLSVANKSNRLMSRGYGSTLHSRRVRLS